MLKLGIESGDQNQQSGKGINVETASVVLKNLKNAGIATYVLSYFGTPAETETSARKTLEFTVQHSDSIGFLNLAIFNMPVCGKASPGSRQGSFMRETFPCTLTLSIQRDGTEGMSGCFLRMNSQDTRQFQIS